MATTNQQLEALFQQMADVLEITGGDRFRVNAFARAARVIGDLTEDIADIGPDQKKLTAIDGIGKGTAERIIQFLETGKIKDHDELLKKVPHSLLALLDVPGLGPKKVALLWKEAGVKSLDELHKKLEGDALAKLPGMGDKTVENLRKNLAFAESAGSRVRIGQALPMALWFVEQLRGMKEVKQAAYAGSLRRGKETIGDIDLLVSASEKDAKVISDAFVKLETVAEVLAKGATKSSIRTKPDDGPAMQVDLRVIEPGSYGAALLYFTGSKEHNIQLRERALKQKMSLNEYGLWKEGTEARRHEGTKGGEGLVAAKTEQDIYKKLGLAWIPPELREARNEIALAEKNKLPELIEVGDIKAELHAHTTASDGRWSIHELAMAAAERGFHTVAVTDHSVSQPIAHGLTPARLEQHIEAVREEAKKLKDTITVLAGSEVDILADGKLDYTNSLLKELDVVVASPHNALSQDPKKATHRLLKAIDNPYVTILGHPTGRLINRREGLSPDMKALIKACAERGIAMEINANSWRLDLRDAHARAAIEAGVKLAINTDAHGPADLDQLIYGVLTARRAGVTKHDVVNCMTKAALAKWIKQTKANA
jgi:DNA polymerase (family X)